MQTTSTVLLVYHTAKSRSQSDSEQSSQFYHYPERFPLLVYYSHHQAQLTMRFTISLIALYAVVGLHVDRLLFQCDVKFFYSGVDVVNVAIVFERTGRKVDDRLNA